MYSKRNPPLLAVAAEFDEETNERLRPSTWIYRTKYKLHTVTRSGYFKGARKLGMEVGDIVFVGRRDYFSIGKVCRIKRGAASVVFGTLTEPAKKKTGRP